MHNQQHLELMQNPHGNLLTLLAIKLLQPTQPTAIKEASEAVFGFAASSAPTSHTCCFFGCLFERFGLIEPCNKITNDNYAGPCYKNRALSTQPVTRTHYDAPWDPTTNKKSAAKNACEVHPNSGGIKTPRLSVLLHTYARKASRSCPSV